MSVSRLGTAVFETERLRSLLATLLFGVAGADPAAYLFALLTLTVVALAASVVPSGRAAVTGPARVLRARQAGPTGRVEAPRRLSRQRPLQALRPESIAYSQNRD